MQSASPSSPAGASTKDDQHQELEGGSANARDSGAATAAAAAAAATSSPDSPAARTDGGESSPAPVLLAAHRKRKPGQSGRGVANLTPEQLAKKRANDREAQRNIRERTKAQIETLERTIEHLKSQQPYQELQRAIREKEVLETELAEIKCMLAAVLSLIQPHVGNTLDSRATTTQTGLHLQAATAQGSLPHPAIPRAGYHHENFMTQIDANAAPLSAASAAYPMPWQNQSSESSASQNHNPLFAPRPRSPNGQPTLLGMASSIYRMTDGEQEALNLLRLGELREQSSTLLQTQDLDDSVPPWTRPPLSKKATCTLDTIVLTFLSDLEKKINQGVPIGQAVGGPEPDWQYIADPDSAQEHLVGPLSRFFGQVLSNRMFPDLQKPAEKVGTAYLLYSNCYWQMTLRQEDYEKVPTWLRPSRAQLTIHHGPWIDAMFWPKMRDVVLVSPQEYVFDELFVPLTRTVSCNWPYGTDGIFDTSQSPVRLTDRFLQHILKLENWTLGLEFARAYPQLKDTFNLRTT